jgi:outer membrane protein TolC
MTMRNPWVAGLLVCVSVTAAADQRVVTNLTMDAAVALAVRDNAELKSLRAGWEAMRERPAQAGALPNPMFTYSGMDTAGGGAWPDTGEKRVMVQQEFPWAGKRGLREGMAAKEAEVARYELEAMTRDVVMRVKESYYDLYAVQRVIAITREEEEVVRRVEKIAGTLYATGERAQVDVIKARTEITLLKQKLWEAQTRESTLKAGLNLLLNRRADEPLGPAVTPPEAGFHGGLEALLALSATNRPEIQGARAQVERVELERKLMAKESVPDYKLGLEYRDVGAGDDMVMVTVGVDWPLWRTKNRAGVREAVKRRASSEAARDAAQRQAAFEVQEASFKLQTARRTLELYRAELIPQAEARFTASKAGYGTGKVDFMDLLESERFLLDARRMTVMAEGAVGMQAARLERAVGAPLFANSAAEGEGK